jgi:hypothetical protein
MATPRLLIGTRKANYLTFSSPRTKNVLWRNFSNSSRFSIDHDLSVKSQFARRQTEYPVDGKEALIEPHAYQCEGSQGSR